MYFRLIAYLYEGMYIMKVKMYDGKDIKLPKYDTYEERLNYLNNYIFNNKDYRNFYGYIGEYTKKAEHEKLDDAFADRWLGMKKENSESIDYHVRNTINYLTTYLTGVKEFSTDDLVKKYLDLKAKNDKNSLNDKEKDEYGNLSRQVIYLKTYPRRHNKDTVVFFINESMENTFAKRGLNDKLKQCEQIKNNIFEYKSNVDKFNIENANILSLLQDEYKFMKEIKDKKEKNKCMDNINKYILRFKEIGNNIELLESRISDLCSDYKYLTEYK